MEKAKSVFALLGLGITIGVILVVVLVYGVNATPKKVTVGGVEFDIPTPAPSQAQHSTLPVATQKAPQEVYFQGGMFSNSEDGVVFTAPSDGNYRFTIEEGSYCWDGQGKCRSIIHGYLNRDIEWGLWHDTLNPINQDYEIGCWENETLANPNCSVGQSTVVFMKLHQYIRWVIMDQKDSYGDNTGYIDLSVEILP